MQQDKYNLSWNNYSNHLRGLLHEMMISKELTDVTLVCDDKRQFKAHKIVLSACSSVFKSIINDLPQTSSVIYLRGIQHQEMESILEFMYLGEASFYQERMNEFLNVAKNLQIKDMSNNVNLTEEPNMNSNDSHQESIKISNSTTDRKSTTTSNQNLEIKEETDYLDNENTDDVNLLDAEDFDFDTVVKEKNSKSDSDDSTVEQFTRHIRNAGVKYTCNQCDYQTTLQKTIRFHIQSKHEGMMYVCNQCDYQANYKGDLNRHIKSKHEGVRYACDQCQYQSPRQRDLIDHIKSKHEGVRYACDHCHPIPTPKYTLIYSMFGRYQCCNEASKIFVLRRFLAEDPSSSSSLVHFKLSKNLRSFEDFRPKIPKIFGKKSLFVEEILKEN